MYSIYSVANQKEAFKEYFHKELFSIIFKECSDYSSKLKRLALERNTRRLTYFGLLYHVVETPLWLSLTAII